MSFDRRRLLAFGLLLCALAALAWFVLATRAGSGGSGARVVSVGVYENAPKVYTNQGGAPAGLFIELLQPIARDEHWSLRYVHCTWSDCLQRVADGRIDLMPDVAYAAEREPVFAFPEVPVAYSWSQVYRNARVPIHSVSDLGGRRIAVLRGGIQQGYVARLMAGSRLAYTQVLVDSYADGFEAVRSGRADAVVTNNFFGGKHARGYGLIETPIMFEPVSLYFVTGKGRNLELLSRIDRQLIRWRANPNSVYYQVLRQSMLPAPATVVPRWLRLGLYALGGAAALLLGFAALLRWQVRRAVADLEQANHRLDQVLNASPVVLFLLRRTGDQVLPQWVSPNVRRLLGFTPEQVTQAGWWETQLHPDDREAAVAGFAQVFTRGQVVQEYRVLDAAGNSHYVRADVRALPAAPGRLAEAVGTWNDLTDAREQAAQVNFLTNFDRLTGLANRATASQRLDQAIELARTGTTHPAVLCIDLDRFKSINDTLGHAAGDHLLQQAAHKLTALAGTADTLARVGGDRFVLILGSEGPERRATSIAQQIVDSFAVPSEVGSHQLIVTASVGISVYPSDGVDADALLTHAELALYEAKQRGRNTWSRFASELSSGALERLVMENSLRGAAARGELLLHYQPQIDLRSGKLVGVEALARWMHPEMGMVPPGQFIPIAEASGIIDDISAWVLAEACRQLVEWRTDGLLVPRVAVNLSATQIAQEQLPTQVAAVLRRTGLAAACLELEITESAIMRQPEQGIQVLRKLKEQGVMLSIDDFGTGHSSLAYLKRLPLDRLKIDQSFVRDIGRDMHDEAISRAVIELARGLGLETVAEGVEREEQAAFLRAEGCEFAQGYLFFRPLPAAEIRDVWAAAGSATRA